MIGKRLRWAAAALGISLASHGTAQRITAQEPYRSGASAAAIGRPIATAVPAASLQRPVPLGEVPVAPTFSDAPPSAVAPVSYQEPAAVVRGQAPDGPYQSMYQPPPPPPPPAGIAPGGSVPPPPYGAPADGFIPGAPVEQPLPRPNGFWDKCHEWFGGSNGKGFNCQSDTAFDSMISPISNPFFFEDPRAVTELRPLFIFQTSPKNSPFMAGGDSFFWGLQGRLALNDRWSIVMNKLGLVSFEPKDPTPAFPGGTALSEINIGPKYTFLHNTTNNTVAAFGVNFDIPTGGSKVFQDTGTLSIDPYFSFAATFGRSSYGQFNFINTTGYNFAVDDQRSDFFHSAFHVDYDIACAHKWYPSLELNWFHYTTSGKANDFNLEGLDLGNFGSTGAAGHNFVSIAPGFRYKFNEHVTTGVAAEFPLERAQDIQNFRMTFDVIFRY